MSTLKARRGDALSNEDTEVLKLFAIGKTVSEVAQILGRNHHTVNDRLRVIYVKLGVNNRCLLAIEADRRGLVTLPGMSGSLRTPAGEYFEREQL